MIYFDNGATSFIKPRAVIEAVEKGFYRFAGAGRSGHKASLDASRVVYDCREKIAQVFGMSDSQNVIFTHNATYALNMAIKGMLKNKKGDVTVSGYEHNSVMRPLKALEKYGINTNIAVSMLFDPDDCVKMFRRNISRKTKLAVVNHVSNVFGFIQPIKELDNLFYSLGIPMIIDASQSAGVIPLNISSFKSVVAVCMPGHKALFGPQGTGIMLLTDKSTLSTIIEGGTGSSSSEELQPDFTPDRFESGTLNTHGICGLYEGIKFVDNLGIENIRDEEHELVCHAYEVLRKVPDTKIYFSMDKDIQSGVISFINNNFRCETLADLLSAQGVFTRAGLHCAPNAHKCAMTYATGTVRISFSPFNTHAEINEFGKIYENIVLKNIKN